MERGDAAPDPRRYGPDGRPAPDGVPLRAEWPDPGWSDTEWAEAEWHDPRPGGQYGDRPPPAEGYPDPYDGPPAGPPPERPHPGARYQAGRRIPPTMQRGPAGPGPGPNGAVASDPRRAGGPGPGTARSGPNGPGPHGPGPNGPSPSGPGPSGPGPNGPGGAYGPGVPNRVGGRRRANGAGVPGSPGMPGPGGPGPSGRGGPGAPSTPGAPGGRGLRRSRSLPSRGPPGLPARRLAGRGPPHPGRARPAATSSRTTAL